MAVNNPKNFEYLCQFLKANREIKSLRLSWNSLLPPQVIEVMSIIKRRKSIQFLDLSYNSMAPEHRHRALAKHFVNMMRRFILRTSIFHLNLEGMGLGKIVAKLVHSFKASSTLNCVHLSDNNVPLEIIYDLDTQLQVPETLGTRLTKFRPIEKEEKLSEAAKQADSEENPTDEGGSAEENFGNVSAPPIKVENSLQPQNTLKEDLIAELKRLQENKAVGKNALKSFRANQPKEKAVKELVAPLMQTPLIY